MSDTDYTTVTIPAGSTEPIQVMYADTYDTPPRVLTAYSGSEALLDLEPVEHGEETENGFKVWSKVPLDDDLDVLWLAIPAG